MKRRTYATTIALMLGWALHAGAQPAWTFSVDPNLVQSGTAFYEFYEFDGDVSQPPVRNCPGVPCYNVEWLWVQDTRYVVEYVAFDAIGAFEDGLILMDFLDTADTDGSGTIDDLESWHGGDAPFIGQTFPMWSAFGHYEGCGIAGFTSRTAGETHGTLYSVIIGTWCDEEFFTNFHLVYLPEPSRLKLAAVGVLTLAGLARARRKGK